VSIPEVQSRSALLYFLEQELTLSTTPAGSDTYIQFNDGGSLGGDANFTWDKTSTVLDVTGLVVASGNGIFSGKLTTAGDLSVSGSSTLGNASGDSVTINAQTIDLANVAAGTDNTVLVYNNSSIVTDEINPSVWDTSATFVEVSGTPVDNQVGVWNSADTLEGDSNLTWNGSTLDIGGALTVDGNTTLGDASGDTATINAQTIVLANVAAGTDNTVLVYNGSSIVTDEIDSRVWGSTLVDGTNGTNTEIAIFTDSNSVEGDSNLTWNGSTFDIGGALTVDGNTTLGDASGDSVTINAQTIDLANVAAGTDNTVLVYNGSSIVTDEIDSKVWAGNLIDYTGTPVNNQLAIWTDTDTVEGDSNLTWDGSNLTATGRLNASTAVQTPLLEYTDGTDALNIVSDGTISFAYGNVGSPSVQTTGLEGDGDGEWTKILTHGSLSGYQTANVVALVTLNPMAYSAGGGVGMHWEFLVTARWGRNGANGTVYTNFTDVTVEAINSDALDGWDPTSDIILTYNSITSAEVWIKGLSNYTSCEVSILGGTSMKPASGNDSTSWQVAPYGASTWATFSSLGTDVYGTWVSKTLDELTVDGNTTLGDASGDSVTINAQTIDLANVAAGTDNTVLIYNGSTVLTDEIDSRVWGSTLLDGTNGTNNELAIFTDSNSVEGDADLTWDGSTLDVGGDLTVSTAGSSIAQESWTGASFATNWQDYSVSYQPVSYFKDSLGLVHLRGLAKCTTGTTPGTTIFTLPVGYRPAKIEMFAVRSNDAAGVDSCRLDVNAVGAVSTSTDFTPASSAWISLSGILFDTR
jgi:microcompartment protein CcmK/EutM